MEVAKEHRIDISFDEKEHAWMLISDTGIGMNQEDLDTFLGTIANSGTRSFIKNMDKEQSGPSDLIGQFGVGFYSSFMVAASVTVTTRKAGEQSACKWYSKGVGTYEISAAEKETHGTDILIQFNEKGTEFANEFKIKQIVKKYSDHISHPIYLTYAKKEYDDKGAEKPSTIVTDKINDGSAIWKRTKNEISDKEYEEFYKSLSHDSEPPLFHLHLQAEGTMEYAALCYVPKSAPTDMYYSDFQTNIRLYIQRVFITDDQKILLPTYLRFVRGVIDSEDLPLNVGREILQENALLTKIQNALVKKLLNKFGELARTQPQVYRNFIKEYNRPLKEGVYQDFANKEQLLELIRFHSTHDDEFVSLLEYKERAKAGQKHVYYLSGTDLARLQNSPLLEHYKKQGVEVLLLGDEIDELVTSAVPDYKEFTFKPINKKSAEKDEMMDEVRDKKLEQELAPLKEKIAQVLKGKVDKVEFSARLDSSPACIVFAEHTPSARMQEMLKSMGGAGMPQEKPILEINPAHSIIQSLKAITDAELFDDLCGVLLEQSLLIENIPFENSHDFVARINRIMAKAAGAGGAASTKRKSASRSSAGASRAAGNAGAGAADKKGAKSDAGSAAARTASSSAATGNKGAKSDGDSTNKAKETSKK